MAVMDPDRSFCELETFCQLVDLWIGWNDHIDGRIQPFYINIDFTRRERRWKLLGWIELKPRKAHPDVISRRIGDGAVNAENRQLNFLSGFYIPAYGKSIDRVPTADHRSAALACKAR